MPPPRWVSRRVGSASTRCSAGRSLGRVDQIVEHLNGLDRFLLGIAPEGTRRKVEQWKTGFYHVAVATASPILLTYLDYSRKIVGIGPLYEPTGNPGQDLAAIRGFYDPRWARYPERV